MWIENTELKGIFLFNDALNTFYLWLYGIEHMIRDYSDSKRRNLLLFTISNKEPFIFTIPQTAFVTPVVEYWLEWEIAQWVHHEGLIRWPWAVALPRSYVENKVQHIIVMCNNR